MGDEGGKTFTGLTGTPDRRASAVASRRSAASRRSTTASWWRNRDGRTFDFVPGRARSTRRSCMSIYCRCSKRTSCWSPMRTRRIGLSPARPASAMKPSVCAKASGLAARCMSRTSMATFGAFASGWHASTAWHRITRPTIWAGAGPWMGNASIRRRHCCERPWAVSTRNDDSALISTEVEQDSLHLTAETPCNNTVRRLCVAEQIKLATNSSLEPSHRESDIPE